MNPVPDYIVQFREKFFEFEDKDSRITYLAYHDEKYPGTMTIAEMQDIEALLIKIHDAAVEETLDYILNDPDILALERARIIAAIESARTIRP